MKFQLLPSSFESDGSPSKRQHLACLVVNDRVAFDAGSLAMGCTDDQRQSIRNVVLTHTHLDHVAGLPMFVDDLFGVLTEPVRVHGTREMIACLEEHIFNGSIYPEFNEFSNEHGRVLEFAFYEFGREFEVGGLAVTPVAVNHSITSAGFLISDGCECIALTGDTAETSEIWQQIAACTEPITVLIECAFPDEVGELARDSRHLTPKTLASELKKLANDQIPVRIVNIKPMYRELVGEQIDRLALKNVSVLEVGRVYGS